MSLTNTLKAMAAAGCSVEQIIAVVEANEADLERYHKTSAERQKRYRERKKDPALRNVASRNVTGVTSPSPPDGFPPSPYSTINNPPSLTPTPVKRAQRAARLSEDWKPSEFQAEGVELEKFRDWARSAPGQKGVKADWDATWRNWMRRVREQGNVTPFRPNGYQQQQSGYQGNQPVISRAENLARMKRGLGLE